MPRARSASKLTIKDFPFPKRKPISLSDYFPAGTTYFYGFPSGEDSGFLNTVPSWIEELVAARPLACAGKDVSVLTFAASGSNDIRDLLANHCGLQLTGVNHVLTFPPHIDSTLSGNDRNVHIKEELLARVKPGTLAMAQPYLDESLRHLYQIDPQITVWLNDKKNMAEFIPAEHLPGRPHTFANGKEFAAHIADIKQLPCVVKVSSSSAGDGVRICFARAQLQEASDEYLDSNGTIFIEEFIGAQYNYGVQFTIPCDASQPTEILGWNQQIVTEQGEFLGGVIYPDDFSTTLQEISKVFQETILPVVRKRGWFGVGGIDVLVRPDGRWYCIDPNFRMTAITSYLIQSHNGTIHTPIASFKGTFTGSREDFIDHVLVHAKEHSSDQILHMQSLTRNGSTYQFNAGLLFSDQQSAQDHAEHLLNDDVQSRVLVKITKGRALL